MFAIAAAACAACSGWSTSPGFTTNGTGTGETAGIFASDASTLGSLRSAARFDGSFATIASFDGSATICWKSAISFVIDDGSLRSPGCAPA